MAFNWFKRKKQRNYPNFWLTYLEGFKTTSTLPIEATRFIAFDTETTGFDQYKDRILSIGAVSIQNKTIKVNQSLELYLQQDIFNPETVKIHGLMKHGSLKKVSEIEAIEAFINYIGNAVLVAHHARFDFGMVNAMLQRHKLGKLKNEFIDTGVLFKKSKHIIYQNDLKNYSLDELATELNVPIADRHTASGDALITAMVFLKTLSRLNKKKSDLQWDYLIKT
ncbi:3'-5' exonuclease [Seonamhaeicola algicola]|uniref:3'-5' exonuclease n=1 Tax=Seonamhaeicola algicola TaxID=1719036 RepID=A0A5C7AUP9_9FLAO|nr:3'-5' exonuclease [Seonamhaeicola algicola]TXE11844.1 3'-5' exonuclease [Seonamhaeicola algicola]